jgi:hypothetical protein
MQAPRLAISTTSAYSRYLAVATTSDQAVTRLGSRRR